MSNWTPPICHRCKKSVASTWVKMTNFTNSFKEGDRVFVRSKDFSGPAIIRILDADRCIVEATKWKFAARGSVGRFFRIYSPEHMKLKSKECNIQSLISKANIRAPEGMVDVQLTRSFPKKPNKEQIIGVIIDIMRHELEEQFGMNPHSLKKGPKSAVKFKYSPFEYIDQPHFR